MRLRDSLSILLLCLSVPVTAKEGATSRVQNCLTDYRQMANVNFGPKFTRTEGFNFKDEKLIYGRRVDLTFLDLPTKTIYGKFERISEQPTYLREHLRILKKQAQRKNRPQREMQEFIVVYRDGTRKSVRYTSNQFHEISEEAGNKALSGASIFTEDIELVIDIHTHPDQGARSDLFFTADDVTGSRDLKAQLERALKRRIDYQMILAPTCENCDDAILSVQF